MKKITFFIIFCFGIFISNGQQTISFEAGEGFTLGDIHMQNGWTATGDGSGNFLMNQVVSDEQSSDGLWSLKTTTEAGVPVQGNPVVGGFYTYPSTIPYTDAVISCDFYIEQPAGAGNYYRFGVLGDGVDGMGNPGLFFITVVDFSNTNTIRLIDETGTFQDGGTWTPDTWINLRIEFIGNQVEYYINDALVATYGIFNPVDITQTRFVHTNGGGQAYFDNFRTNDEPLSVDGFDNLKFDYFVDNQNVLNLSASTPLSELKIYNMLGQEVLSQNLSNQQETVDINRLNTGVYLAQVQINNNIETFKFVRK